MLPPSSHSMPTPFSVNTGHVPEVQPDTVEYCVGTKKDTLRWFYCCACSTANAAKRVVPIVGVLQDVTKRREATEALAVSHALHDRNRPPPDLLTAATTSSECNSPEEPCQHPLGQVGHAARRADRVETSQVELDEVATIASHELKSQLRDIGHLVDWLTEDTWCLLPTQSQGHLEKLSRRVERLTGMIDDLIAYLRVTRYPVDDEAIDIKQLVATIYQALTPPSGFTLHIEEKIPVLITHRTPLGIVLRNLLDNAIKHHNRPEGHLWVAVSSREDYIEFVVTDDGPGIPFALQSQIFQVFRTLQPRDQVESHGMGLPIARKVVETYGGSLWIEPTAGRGTTFRFTWQRQIESVHKSSLV